MTNTTVVVYKSKTGFSHKYAQWIAEDLGADLLSWKEATVSRLLEYDTIIYGGGLYAGGVNGLKLITENFPQLKSKRLIVFSVGASPERQEIKEALRKKNFTGEMYDAVEFYMLRGGFDYNKCGLIDKLLMNMLKIQLKSIKEPNEDDRGMLAAYDTPVDFAVKENVQPIIASVKGLKV